MSQPAAATATAASFSPSGPGPCSSSAAAAAVCSSTGEPAAVAASGPGSLPVHLPLDALECVFSYLPLIGLHFSACVCGEWAAAVGGMRGVGAAAELRRAHVADLGRSVLCRHVSACHFGYPWRRKEHLHSDDVSSLARSLPHLTLLNVRVRVAAQPRDGPSSPALAFPMRLRQLWLELEQDPSPPAALDADPVAFVNTALAAVGRLCELRQLRLRVCRFHPRVSLAPLARLPLLREFEFRWADLSEELSDAQVEEIRSMVRPEMVDLHLSTETLARVVRAPHLLRWHSFCPGQLHDDAFVALLPQLPRLRRLSFAVWACASVAFLRQLPRLTALDLPLSQVQPQPPERLASILHSLGRMRELVLYDCPTLASAHLAHALSGMPRLRQLELAFLPQLESLGFLALPSLSSSLEQLSIGECTGIPVADLRHLQRLRSLTSLTLQNCLSEPLDGAALASLTPPESQQLMPRLVRFSYTPPSARCA